MASQPDSALKYWNNNANFWDEAVGVEGNEYWTALQRPALERLIKFKPGCKALDLATGNGLVARWLAQGGATVIATDGSTNMLGRAARHTPKDQKDLITYEPLDVTNPADFSAFTKSASGVGRSWQMSGIVFHVPRLCQKGQRLRYCGHEHDYHGHSDLGASRRGTAGTSEKRWHVRVL